MGIFKHESLGKYLSISSRALNSYLDRKLEKHDIARGQFPYLIALYHKEGVSQQDLCDFYNFDKAAAVRAIKTLEEKGFVKKEIDLEDRRQYKIFLTEKGKEFKSIFLDILRSSEELMKSGLSEKDINDLIKNLKIIIRNLGKNLPDTLGVDL